MKTALTALLLVLVTGCGGTEKPATFTVFGAMTLEADGVFAGGNGEAGDPCSGTDGYDDVGGGAQVVVRNAAGKTVGVGELEQGILTAKVGRFVSAPCKFIFSIERVTADKESTYYSVEVAGRGQTQFKKADADDLALTLG